MSQHVVVTGVAGRLGGRIVHEFSGAGYRVTRLSRAQLDITDRAAVRATMARLQPDVIVNCAAYNAVDRAEGDGAAAFAINADGPAALADAALALDALLVHYGSDFVFDGSTSVPYGEAAATNPLSVYGHSKLAGERAVRVLPRHYVVRVASLFGGSSPTGQTATIDFMIDALVARRPVRALVDRTVTPSHVRDVASTTRALIERRAPFGTYHCVCSGSATWFDVASELARYLDADDLVRPARTADLTAAATRPAFAALSNQKLQALGVHLPFWQTALKDHLAERVVGLASPPRTRIA